MKCVHSLHATLHGLQALLAVNGAGFRVLGSGYSIRWQQERESSHWPYLASRPTRAAGIAPEPLLGPDWSEAKLLKLFPYLSLVSVVGITMKLSKVVPGAKNVCYDIVSAGSLHNSAYKASDENGGDAENLS